MVKYLSLAMASVLFIVASNISLAQQYQPAIAQFTGTNGLSFPADESLDLPGYGTIEFWVAAGWQGTPPVHPAIISYVGVKSVVYALHITADRQALGLSAAGSWDLVPFNFADGLLHHVAVVTVGDISEVYIDGIARGAINAGYGRGPGSALYIGSLDGANSPFVGSIAGLRIWDTPLDIEDVNQFSMVDVRNSQGAVHPELESLVAHSDFDEGRRLIALIDLGDTEADLAPGEPRWNDATDKDVVIEQ